MWRGYGSGEVALVFGRKELQVCLDREGEEFEYFGCGQLIDVAYSSDDDVFPRRFGEFVSLLKCKAQTYLLDHQFDATFIKLLLEAAAGYKHRAFVEEREVRIALFPHQRDSQSPRVDDRDKKYKTIKSDGHYIELFSGAGKLPITKVIIGPQKDQGERVSKVKEVLKEYPDIQVVRSQTPYRPG